MKTAELRVLCEGLTEYNFITQVLAPHLKGFRVFASPQNLGGVQTFEKLREAIKRDLGRFRPHQYITTMIDLYALPDYPGDPKTNGLKGAARALQIEAAMSAEMPAAGFLPYIQVHEFEALVFVDLDQLPRAFPDGEANRAPQQLRREIGSLAPEDIDDGPEIAPSKRLIRAFPAYAYIKPSVGPLIAANTTLPRLRAKCPHFNSWIHKLERLTQTS